MKKTLLNVVTSMITAILLMFSLSMPTAYAEEGASSFNPTEPEVQLGDITEVGIITASGEVNLNTKSSQGIITGEKLVEIDGVKGKGKIIYILDKQTQDIISIQGENMKVTGKDGSVVQINEVDELIGNNGVADKDGFKSNLVPNNIPKTGLPPQSTQTMLLYSMFALGIVLIGFGIYRKKNVEVQ